MGGICFTAVKIYDRRDKVTLTEKNSWGKKDSLKGLSMQLNMSYKDQLRWTTVVPMDNVERAETEYDFSITPVYVDLNRYTGLDMDCTLDTSFIQDKINKNEIEGVVEAYKELADGIGPSEEAEKEIYIKDYAKYYQYQISLDIPGTDIYRKASWDKKAVVQNQENYTIQKLNEFFKIPVLNEERWYISIGKNEYGNIYHTGSGNGEGDFFYMWTFNAMAEDSLYFTFDTHSRDGVVMDTSLIPGGYGIYCLPYDGTLEGSEENADRISVNADGLKMIYSLDPEIDVMYLQLSENQDKLILHAEEYGKYVMTVIDVANMETLQKIPIMDWKPDYGYQIYEKGDFIVNIVHKVQEEGRIEAVVLKEKENGEYEVAFICDIQNKEIPSFNTSNMYLAFDGNRLAMAGFLEEEAQWYRETCNIFVAVCDAEGMQYYGEYRNSLETGYDEDNYYYHCHGYGWNPIVLAWGKAM